MRDQNSSWDLGLIQNTNNSTTFGLSRGKRSSKINKVNGILKIGLLGKEKNNLFKSKVSLKNKSESSKDSENNSSNTPKGKKN